MSLFSKISCGVALLFLFFLNSPVDFPVGAIFKVEQGASLRRVSLELKQMHLIRSRLVFEAFVIIYGAESSVISTDYYFENKLPVYEVARRISKGEHRLPRVAVTIPEGFDTSQIADIFAKKLINFNKEKFLINAKDKEGRLFPDTYFFSTTDNETEVLKSMSENFKKKMLSLKPEIALSLESAKRTEQEIIIMASLIEGEAKGDTDRGFISGILWKRFDINMPLQVDVAPETYKKTGLPKNPIGNPGIEALKAAIHPEKSLFLYYLHDKNGVIHYAKTFIEHQKNIKKYLK